MDGNDDTTNLGLAIVAVVVFVILTIGYAFGCEIKPQQGSDPTNDEVAAAFRLAGASEPGWRAIAVAPECMPDARLEAPLAGLRLIILRDDWRDVGGLTRLVHGAVHVAQLRGENRPVTPAEECEASKLAADYADLNGFTNEARRERAYGSAFCW